MDKAFVTAFVGMCTFVTLSVVGICFLTGGRTWWINLPVICIGIGIVINCYRYLSRHRRLSPIQRTTLERCLGPRFTPLPEPVAIPRVYATPTAPPAISTYSRRESPFSSFTLLPEGENEASLLHRPNGIDSEISDADLHRHTPSPFPTAPLPPNNGSLDADHHIHHPSELDRRSPLSFSPLQTQISNPQATEMADDILNPPLSRDLPAEDRHAVPLNELPPSYEQPPSYSDLFPSQTNSQTNNK